LVLGYFCVGVGDVVRFDLKRKRIPLTIWPGLTHFTRSSIVGVLLALPSSVFSLSGSLIPSSQVSQGAFCLVKYDGSGRVHSGQPDVLVSSSLSPWRYEVRLIRRMRRLCVWRLDADVRQGAASLALWV
jgi:hypothetical protein